MTHTQGIVDEENDETGPPPPAKNRTHHHSLAPLYRPQIHFENTNLIRREMG